MADPKEWGPLLWKIIHIQCEKLGKQTHHLFQNDELIVFNRFVKQIYYIIPCDICKKHYNDYSSKYMIKHIEYKNLHNFARTYFFNLHNNINISNVKEIYKIEDLDIYNSITKEMYNSYLKELETLLKKYSLHYYISSASIKDFFVSINKLKRLC